MEPTLLIFLLKLLMLLPIPIQIFLVAALYLQFYTNKLYYFNACVILL